MYFDFNLPYTKNDAKNPNRLRLILARYSQLEESVVALNYTTDQCAPEKTLTIEPISTTDINFPVVQLTRLTLEIDEPVSKEAITALRSKYQLIAIRTCNPRVFEEACSSYDIDIISLDSSKRLSFRLDPLLVQQAIARGVYFELCYSHGIRDDTKRAYVLQTSKELVRVTNGDHFIVSSEAFDVSNIRSSFDIVYLLKGLGLPNDKAKFATGKNGEALVKRLRKRQNNEMLVDNE
ncbi:PHP domain-like protein [Lichtheimia hyalospora FSU 10163]|nr:PHP domain-like protein [Lichtheimia hyalospora FSU 10163]